MHVEIDLKRNFALVTLEEDFTFDILRAAYLGVIEHPDHRSGLDAIWDVRATKASDLDLLELGAFRDLLHDHIDPDSDHAKTAIVTGPDVTFGMARVFQSVCDADLPAMFEVFETLEEAEAWLRGEAVDRRTDLVDRRSDSVGQVAPSARTGSESETAIRIESYADRQLAIVTIRGAVTFEMLRDGYLGLLAHPDHKKGMDAIWDTTAAKSSTLTEAELDGFRDLLRDHIDPAAGQVKTAIVTPTDVTFGMARVIQSMYDADLPVTFKIFATIEDAKAWLAGEAGE